MISAIYSTSSIICINFFVKNHTLDGNYAAVVDSDANFDFPSVRIDLTSFDHLEHLLQVPTVYIVNSSGIGVRDVLNLRRHFGYSSHTKYVFSSENLTSLMVQEKSTDFLANSILINSIDGGIYSGSGARDKTGDCAQNFTHVTFKKPKLVWGRKTLGLCLFVGEPYVIFEKSKLGGIEVDTWVIIFDSLNITATYKTFIFPKDSAEHFFDEIFSNGSCDVFSGMYPIKGYFDFTHAYFFDSSHWVLRTPKEIPRWKYALEIYSRNTWLLWFVSAIALSITKFFMTKVKNQRARLTDGLVIIYRHFLEQSQRLKPSRASETILLCTILLTTCWMNLFYDSRFAFLLTGLKYEDTVDSFEEIMENEYTLKFSRTSMNFFHEPRILKYFEKHFQESTLILNITEDNMSSLFLKRMFNYQLRNFLDEDNRPTLRMLEKPVVTLPFVSILRRASPLTDVINDKLGRLKETGIFSLITSKYATHKIDKGRVVRIRKLSLHSVQLAFGLWILGMVIASLQFYYELKI